MKRHLVLSAVALAFLFALKTWADNAVTVLENGPNHSVIQNVVDGTDGEGNPVLVTNTYTAIASGMHAWDSTNQQWIDTTEAIQAYPNGGIVGGQSQIVFSADAADQNGTVDILSLDGKRFRIQPVGIGYFDASSQSSAMIAVLTNSIGVLVPDDNGVPNNVVYSNALAASGGSGVSCDVLYSYRRGSFGQDIVLHSGLPSPTLWNLNPETTTVEVISEFLEFPDVALVPNALSGTPLDNVDLDCGEIKFTVGRAFLVGAQDPGLVVAKSWTTIAGHQTLLEAIPYVAMNAAMQVLPVNANANANGGIAVRGRQWPTRRIAQVRRAPMRIAKPTPSRRPEFVVDFTTVNGTLNNYSFAAGSTYYANGPVTLAGSNTVFEAAVIKFAPASSNACLTVTTPITWKASSYHALCLTARDDSSQGDAITGASNTISGYYGNPAIKIDYNSTSNSPVAMSSLRVCFANTGLSVMNNATNPFVLSHAQFVACGQALNVSTGSIVLRNVLINSNVIGITSTSSKISIEHLTADVVSNLVVDVAPSIPSSLGLTNSLLIAVTNIGLSGTNYVSNSIASVSSPVGIFHSVGAGNHYLPTTSPYISAGTTNINTALAAALASKTVFAPQIMTNAISFATVWTPQVARDVGPPSLGWAYDPLDFLVSGVSVTGSGSYLLLTNGVAVGVYGPSGFSVGPNGTLASMGTPLTLNRIARYQTVQEQPFVFGAAGYSSEVAVTAASSPYAILRFRFTDFPSPAGSTSFRTTIEDSTTIFQWLTLQDCAFRGSDLTLTPWASGGSCTIGLTNNVFERCTVSIQRYAPNSACTLYAYNNFFWRGTVSFYYDSGSGDSDATDWGLYDNFFDTVTLSASDNNSGSYLSSYFLNGYNGYLGTTALPNGGTHNQTISSVAYQTGPLSSYYQPTNSGLFHLGSTAASSLGLFRYTTATNQVAETTNTVTIGAHWVALNALGLPVDTFGDGIPDYLSDVSGNGTLTAPGVTFSGIGAAGTNGTAGIQVYTPLK